MSDRKLTTIMWDNSGTSRDDQHPLGAVFTIVIDVDRVPRPLLHRIPHLPRRRHCFHAGGTNSERWCLLGTVEQTVLMFFIVHLRRDTRRRRFQKAGGLAHVPIHLYTLEKLCIGMVTGVCRV